MHPCSDCQRPTTNTAPPTCADCRRAASAAALNQYAYWIDRARAHAENPQLGHASESYRCAAQMAYRALGRHDVLQELAR